MKKIFLILLVIISSFPIAFSVQAEGASLYLSPASGTFFVGSTFDISIFVNTGGENINAVEINLKFDPTKLQVASPTAGKSFIEVWVSQPTFSNTKGQMSFIGGLPSPGIKTSAGLVSTITLRAISPGKTSILFLDSSKVLRNDPEGTNILTSMGRGVYTLLIPPPEGPKVFSPTHPDQNKWYKNNNPTISWEREEGVTDFSFSFDQDPAGFPDNTPEGEHTSVSFSDVGGGMWYFHVKARKAKVWGGMSHYLVRIDTTPPAVFTPTVEPSPKTTERQPLVSFITTDALSGMDYYQLKYIDITPERKEEISGFFTEVSSPYKLPSLEIGKYLVIVRAYDIAGNWREGKAEIQIFPEGIFLTKRGIQFREITLPWWIVFVILLVILLLVLLYFSKRYRDLLRRERGELDGIEKKLGKEKEKLIIERVKREARKKEIEREKEILRKMRLERDELERKLRELSEKKKILELKKAQLFEKKIRLEQTLDGIKKKENQIETGKAIEEKEKFARLPGEKQKIEKMRWEIEDKRREIEKERWHLEDEKNEIESQIKEIDLKYQRILEEKNNLKEKTKEIDQALKSMTEISNFNTL
ncbi:hypothetical protein KJA16_02650 [Patescibacteria group bacterium]|nr:hypothetical protein [Patescibacteria group bacterium]